MSNSFKKAENDVYEYLNHKFRVGHWSSTSVAQYYNNLGYKESITETDKLNKFLHTNIERLPDVQDVSDNPKLKFTIRSLIERVYKSREELEEVRRIFEEAQPSPTPTSGTPTVTLKVKPGKISSFTAQSGNKVIQYSYRYLVENGPQEYVDTDGTKVIFQADDTELLTI